MIATGAYFDKILSPMATKMARQDPDPAWNVINRPPEFDTESVR